MPKIIVKNLYEKVISFEKNNDQQRSVLALIQEENIDWMHACGAKGNCTTCKFMIDEGEENLSELSEAELRYKNAGRLLDKERLACQTIPNGSIEILVPEKYKLPHMNYSF